MNNLRQPITLSLWDAFDGICIIMAATRSKTSSDSKRGNFEEDDVQMPLKLVKELLKQQASTLKVFLSAFMDSVNTRFDNLVKDGKVLNRV